MNSPPSPESRDNLVTTTAQNLRAASFAVLQRATPPSYFRVSLQQLFVLCLLVWVFSAVDDLIEANFIGALSVWGIIGDAALNYFWLAAVGFATMLLGSARYFLPLAIGSAAVSIVIAIFWIPVGYAWQHLAPASYGLYALEAWWLLFALEVAAFYRVLSWYCALAVDKRLALGLVYGGIIFLSVWYFPPQPLISTTWAPQKNTAVNVEDTYYAQHNLLNQALYEIAPETAGDVDIFTIGFAAYGDQNVFYHEVQSALEILATQFDSTNRSLALINNPTTVHTAPIASLNNLRRAVRVVSEKMNLDEDVLLLFLSSHGSEDGRIAVALGELNLNDVSAEDIRDVLDESNVYWRIIIVSACYSGSFIDALKSPTTLILTAAAADKASFGCDHIRDWTYFGEAFFTRALPENRTFVSSFNAAREILIERELEEGKEPSEPQLWLGEAMKAYLSLHAL